MPKSIQIKTNFTAGEVSADVLGRTDLRAYENGARELRNVFIDPTGGVRRRAGTMYRATLSGPARLIPYEVSVDQTFLLALTDLQLHIYQNGSLVTSIAAPWTAAQLDQINWAQSSEALLVVHPDVFPKRIIRSSTGTWSIIDWFFNVNGNAVLQPYYKFVASDVTLFSTNTTGTATITASAPIFTAAHVGVRLRIRTSECTITGYTNPVTVTATIHGTLAANPATTDWREAAFSTLRGYPTAIGFHQDRLVIGGSKSLPNRLWLSRTGDNFNFDLGTGLDDDAIEFGVLSDQLNAIRAVMSSRHLQVFTSGAEYMVTGDPLTPTNVQVKRQTRVGTVVDRTIPPIDVEGATLFVARTRDQIREFLFTDLEQAYQATDLALLARNMIAGAVDQDYDKKRRLLYVVREDGQVATLTMFRPENVNAWTLITTDGQVRGVAVAGDLVYLAVQRGSSYFLEELRDDMNVDAGITATAGSPQTVWSGLSHLNGRVVKIVADGTVRSDLTVSAGAVTLSTPASAVQMGLAYTHRIVPLPASVLATPAAHKVRLVRLTLKLLTTSSLRLDTGRGVRAITLPTLSFSGDYAAHAYGWHRDFDDTLWTITSDVPLPFNLLSTLTELQVN